VIRILDQMVMTLLLLLTLALFVLWFRSHIVGDRYRWTQVVESPDGHEIAVRSGDLVTGEGGVAAAWGTQRAADPDGVQRLRRRVERRMRFAPVGYSRVEAPQYPVRSGDGVLAPLGINYDYENRFDGSLQRTGVTLAMPLWLMILVTAAYPLGRFIRGVIERERQDRIFLGLCPRCGVDVRDRPSRCPCCGKRQPLLLPQRVAA